MKKFTKRSLAVFISIVLIITSIFAATLGVDAAQTTKAGDKATYKFDSKTGTLTISGEGPMYDFRATNLLGTKAPWQDNKPNIKKVVVEEGITSIGQYSFYNCTALTEVSLPSTVTEIRGMGDKTTSYGAFQACTALTTITIPSGVKTIGTCAFKGDTALTTVYLNEGLTSIGYGAFFGCSELRAIAFPNSLTDLGETSFQDCKKLADVTYGTGMTETGVYAFNGAGVRRVNFSPTIAKISTYCFYGCPMTEIELPETVTTIATRSFGDTYNLRKCIVNNPNAEFDGIRIAKDDPFHSDDAAERTNPLTIAGHKGSTAEEFAKIKGYEFESIDDCDHLNTYEKISLAPTCTNTGILQTICSDCYRVVREDTIEALGHSYEVVETIDETKENGHIIFGFECSVCKDAYSSVEHQRTPEADKTDDSTNYIWIEGNYEYKTTATCTRGGYETFTCTFPECKQIEVHLARSTKHDVVDWDVTKQPTCTATGSRTGGCKLCGEEVTEDIPALGHTYDDSDLTEHINNVDDDGHMYDFYKCQVCGKTVTEYTHDVWVDGFYTPFVISQAHCVVPGAELDTCDICGETRTVQIPANGEHEWYVTDVTEPTCTAVGKTFYACKNCNLTKSENTEALGHDYQVVSESHRDPTCTINGFDTFKCSRCSASKQEVLKATGHIADESTYKVTKQPDCTNGGTATATCSVCEENYTIDVDPLDHDFKPVRKRLTAYPGHSHVTPTCSRCHATDAAYIEHTTWEEGWYTVETITESACIVQGRVRYTCTYCNETLTEVSPALGHYYVATGTITINDKISYRCKLCNTFATMTPVEVFEMWDDDYILNDKFDRTATNPSTYLDANGDGYINVIDYVMLKRLSAEYQVKHPVEPDPDPDPDPEAPVE